MRVAHCFRRPGELRYQHALNDIKPIQCLRESHRTPIFGGLSLGRCQECYEQDDEQPESHKPRLSKRTAW